MQQALDFLKAHNEIVLATSEDNFPHLRMFQIMKQEDNRLYFATSPKKAVLEQLVKNPNIEIIAFS